MNEMEIARFAAEHNGYDGFTSQVSGDRVWIESTNMEYAGEGRFYTVSYMRWFLRVVDAIKAHTRKLEDVTIHRIRPIILSEYIGLNTDIRKFTCTDMFTYEELAFEVDEDANIIDWDDAQSFFGNHFGMF